MSIGFYAGSFDPFTNGHLHVVTSAASLFDKIVIGIGVNPDKKRRFDADSMKLMIEKTLECEKLYNCEVISYNNLSADVALKHGATFLVRGIRNDMDYGHEENLASINEEISGIDSIYFRAGNMGNISSSMVMELLRNGKDVSKYLPKEILEFVIQK